MERTSGRGARATTQSTPHGRRQSASYRSYMLLRFAIKAGGLPPGMVIEERSIMEGFGFSRAAVREALRMLSGDGLLERKTGVGTTITVRPVPIALSDVFPLAADQRISIRLTETFRLGESRYLDTRLGAHPQGDLVMSEFFLAVGGSPIGVLSTFSPGGVPGTSLLRPAWEMPRMKDAFPRMYDVEFGGMDIAIDARLADEGLAELLEVEPGAPILAREQVLRDVNGVAWEYGIAQYRADRVLFRSVGVDAEEYSREVDTSWVEEFTTGRY